MNLANPLGHSLPEGLGCLSSLFYSSARNKDQELISCFLKIECFISYYTAVPLKMYGKYGRSKKFLVGQMLKLVGKWPVADFMQQFNLY